MSHDAEWEYSMQHPSWYHLPVDQNLRGIDFGKAAVREATDEAAADDAIRGDGVPDRWDV